MHLVLEEYFDPEFTDSNFGYRKGRSQRQAIRHLQALVNEGRAWAVAVDLRAFFDNIDHEMLLKALRHHTDNKWVLLYVGRWLTAPMQQRDETLVERHCGAPQGGPLSPVLANLFLHYALDHWLATHHAEVPFCRYADGTPVQA